MYGKFTEGYIEAEVEFVDDSFLEHYLVEVGQQSFDVLEILVTHLNSHGSTQV